MKNQRDLCLLRSKFVMPDGDIELFDTMNRQKQSEVILAMCENISRQISSYYSRNLSEWGRFISRMS